LAFSLAKDDSKLAAGFATQAFLSDNENQGPDYERESVPAVNLLRRWSMSRPRNIAKSIFCAALKYSGAAWIYEHAARWSGKRQLPILLFHRVSDLIPEDGLTVPPDRFRTICALLQKSFRVVSLATVFEWMQTGADLPARTVAITFDDCYQDNLHAAHVLADHGLSATFFIPTAFVGTDHVFSWDQHLPRLANLNWPDLRTMLCLGHEIGSHTVTHPNMGLLSRDEAEQELVESKKTLENHLERPCRLFAYPFGGKANWKTEWTELAVRTGYLGAVSAYGGFVRPGCDPHLLPREPMPSFTSMLNLELHLCGCLDWMYALKRRLGLIPPPPLPRECPTETTTSPSRTLLGQPTSPL
jgi:peptidoglycan/xylan/chitin deacetylase (PgdA/CDA1 family)